MYMKEIFKEQNRSLLAELVRTDFKLRYQGSVLGYAWSLLKPLFMFLVLYVVFAIVFKFGDDIPNYPIYLLLGIVLWNFFMELTQQGLGSIVNRGGLIRKIAIPSWMITLAASIGAIINVALNMVVVLAISLFTGMDFLATSPLLLIYIIEIYVFAFGVSLILATLYVKYRDMSYIWDVVLQAGFYATPILYTISFIENLTIQKLMFMNPVAHAIQGARKVFVTNEAIVITDVLKGVYWHGVMLLIVCLTVALGAYVFKKESKYFAENL